MRRPTRLLLFAAVLAAVGLGVFLCLRGTADGRGEGPWTNRPTLQAISVPDALAPSDGPPVLIPKPKKASLGYNYPIRIDGSHLPDPVRQAMNRRFIDAGIQGEGIETSIDPSLKPGGYRLEISPGSVRVRAKDSLALRYAAARLAQIAFARDGAIWLPTGSLEDWPSSPWRGVHLFVGPRALPFHRQLWERVLLTLGFNKVVVQCEQTGWRSAPGTRTGLTMPRDKLADLFAMYRSMGVEPIPLIESFGHMGWLFANGKNRDLALDPKTPWAIDPRKPQAEALIGGIWKEAIGLLHPATVHFGLDEVGMRGQPGESPQLTDLWQRQVSFLSEIATRNHVRPMFWGDQALGPGEAVDYTLASTAAAAVERRAAIPRDAMIGDWHYAAGADPTAFAKSLDLWKAVGFEPIAASWYRPENVRAFNIAAASRGLGTLQTTWAGYESSEQNLMGASLPQFTAMVLAAEYSWSGRQDPLDKLGYDAAAVFREMYFGKPHIVSPRPGIMFGDGPILQIGDVRYRRLDNLALRNSSDEELRSAPTRIELAMDVTGHEINVALQTSGRGRVAEPVADLGIDLEGGMTIKHPLLYGLEVRAASDPGVSQLAERAQGVSSLRIQLPTGARIRTLSLSTRSNRAGLRLVGVTVD